MEQSDPDGEDDVEPTVAQSFLHTIVAATPWPHPISSTWLSGRMPRPSTIF
ncbi:MAG: hypothetical protein ACSLFD_12345 [Solirubrobacterales bacterium]